MGLQSRLLHASEVVNVYHVQCHPHDHDCGATEATSADIVAFPLRGVFIKHPHNGRGVVAHAGKAVFFNRGESYRVSHPRGGDDCLVLEPAAAVLRELRETLDARANPSHRVCFHVSQALLPAQVMLHQRLLWRNLQHVDRALMIDEHALDLMLGTWSAAHGGHACGACVRGAALRRRREQVRAVTILLATDPAHRWTLPELARRVYSSPFHLARAFRRECGLPIHRYLVQVRLAYTLEAVLDSDRTLTTIAVEAGFATPSHFTAAFRRQYGFAPSSLRRNSSGAAATALRKISTVPLRVDH
ncbi:MAG: AraC family transcriptional regulator [Sinobacteraceae bacterium]|nr:AraC family transcriptional regulator [Nevskiaceae bacterium]